ncbi:MAG: EAL domain-containing protein [Ruminococcus sp.]|nr:EAL domain-containing protein [Ruminococcus sp.]
MTYSGKRRRYRKKYFRLRKNRIWISVLMYFIVIAFAVVFLAVFVSAFMIFAIKGKIASEHDTDQLLAKQYVREIKTETRNPYNVIDEAGRDYFIRDKNGTVIYLKGRNTCGEKGYDFSTISMGVVGIESGFDEYKVYPDSENDSIRIADNDFAVNYKRVLKDTQTLLDSASPKEYIELPVWLAVPVLDGEQTIFFKACMRITAEEAVFAYIMLVALAALMLLMFLVMLIDAVSNAVTQNRITKLFFTDIVTKGHNRMWYLYRGEQIIRRRHWLKSGLAVVNISFVDYRRFCVCHSIAEGEQILQQIYACINSRMGRKELCAHTSDGSYALMLRYSDEALLRRRIDELLQGLQSIDTGHRFTFHAGVDIISLPDESAVKLFFKGSDIDLEIEYNNACTAQASIESSDDSGAVYFDEKFAQDQKWIDTVQERQQSALENNEFVVYYQPKYDPRTNTLRGAEALIRWQSPDLGFVTPYRFIPQFEKNGFITEIDHYMISKVAKDQRRWLDMGYKCVPISVNVSRAHFIESDLAEQIRDMVDAAGTPHELIEIELTESAFFDDKKAMVTTINKLKEYGFSVSMDDFGSGYSSLNSLKDMPLDVLKLDAEFFRGEMAGTDRGEIVVSEAIKLAKSLNMRTVAEGVEVREQVEFLASQGCDMIQGYYFAKPMPAADYEQRMKK